MMERSELATELVGRLLERSRGAAAAQDLRYYVDTAIAYPESVIQAVFGELIAAPAWTPMPTRKDLEERFDVKARAYGVQPWRIECDRVCRPHFPRQEWRESGDCCETALMHNIRMQRWAANPDWRQSDADHDAMVYRLAHNLPPSMAVELPAAPEPAQAPARPELPIPESLKAILRKRQIREFPNG